MGRRKAFREMRAAQREDEYQVQKHNEYLYRQHLDHLLDNGRVALSAGRLDDALMAWANVRMRFPDARDAYVLPLAALLDAGRLDEAELLAASGRERFPGNLVFAVQHAQAARLRGATEEALKRWETVRHQFPASQSGFVHGAVTYAEAGRIQDAEELVEKAMDLFASDPGPFIVHAQLAQRRRNLPAALDRWDLVRQRFPSSIEWVIGLARCLREMKRLDQLDALLVEAKDAFANEPWFCVEYATVAHDRGELGEAKARWDWVIGRFPSSLEARRGASRTLAAIGNHQEAEGLLRPTARPQ